MYHFYSDVCYVRTISKSKRLDFDIYPIALFETDACENVSGNLICKDTHPNTDDAPMEQVTAYIRKNSTYDSYTQHRAFCGVLGIASTS